MLNITRSLLKMTGSIVVLGLVVSGVSRTSAAVDQPNQLTAAEKKAGWTLLFDGKTLNGWRGYKKTDAAGGRWLVENGLLTVDPGNGKDTHGALDIITTAEYDRFDLTWEWRIAEGGNSGLKYFVLEDQSSAIGHEYQLIDDERHPDAKVGPHRQTAAFYDVLQATNRPLRPAGQFNQSRVVSNGKTIEHWLNGKMVLQYELDSPALRDAIAKSKFKDIERFGKLQNGHILLQDHGNRVWYRNIKIRKLAADTRVTQSTQKPAGARGIQIVANEKAQRVDITVDGTPFTSYIWPNTLKKPVLYPLVTSRGTAVTRGFPLEPRAGERVDHPHHVGLWFNHGDVNGLDFWNNSDAIPAEQAPKMGTIRHKRIVEAKSGPDRGELVVEMDWLQPDGVAIVREQTRFIFRGSGDMRSVDRITTLTALDKPVVFRDNKEGVLGMRVRRELEQPADKPEVFTDASGKATAVPVLNNEGVTGEYTSSEGLKGDKVWGTRGRWCLLGGKVGTEPVTLAMLDHPSNPNAPTYWHARGYGLFSANVFGRKVFDAKQEELTLTLEPGKSVTFRHRVLILDNAATADTIEREYRTFAAAASSANQDH
jgi:methane monooxygenase PmoA-like/3-keto-disaccharide hydrolase